MIGRYKPEFVLFEGLNDLEPEGTERFLVKYRTGTQVSSVDDTSQDIVLRALAQTGAKLAGCDINKILPKREDSSDPLEHMLKIYNYQKEMQAIREQVMGERMVKYILYIVFPQA